MARQVLDTVRTKKVFNLSIEEFLKGEWIKWVPKSELVEVQYKNHFLSIHDAKISKITEKVEAKENAGSENKGSKA